LLLESNSTALNASPTDKDGNREPSPAETAMVVTLLEIDVAMGAVATLENL
jgi:hypothetical protein